MLVRRIAFLVALLAFTAVLTSSLIRNEDTTEQPAVAPPPVARAAPEVDGTMPGDTIVEASVGDVVSISVRPKAADSAVIEALGVSTDASPEVPGVLEFIPSEAGRFPVVLESSGEKLGTVVVAAGDS